MGPKDTFDGSAQGKSQCEVDSNEGLGDGRTVGRTECMWKVKQCSSLRETTTTARATCCARCEDLLFL